jgi:Carboxypeptidase regulatory-like domain
MTKLRVFALCAATAWSQSLTSLNGTVTDQTGGVVAGAAVEIVNLDTASKRSVLSDAAGLYSFSQVVPGRYRVTAKATGFSATTIDSVELVVNTPSTIAIKLQVGAVTETIAVASEAAQVNTVDASLRQRGYDGCDYRTAVRGAQSGEPAGAAAGCDLFRPRLHLWSSDYGDPGYGRPA